MSSSLSNSVPSAGGGEPPEALVDRMLASALQGDRPRLPDPASWEDWRDIFSRRVRFHGIAGLLWENAASLDGWPPEHLAALRDEAREQAMWDMGHTAAIVPVVEALAAAGIDALVLKGTALAHDLYPRPSLRTRGDTDLMVAREGLDHTRGVLSECGFTCETPATAHFDRLQETWSIAGRDGVRHAIDLHWQALDAPALEGILPFDTCMAESRALPGLSPAARRLNHPAMLLHAIVHRAKHMVSAYHVDGTAHHDGDRLIWLMDVDLLARALDEGEWTRFCELSLGSGVAQVCIEGLESARSWLGTPIPGDVLPRLAAGEATGRSDYLIRSGGVKRTWRNMMATNGALGRFHYLRAKLLPAPSVLRAKYPALSRVPVVFLYVWRVVELILRRGAKP